jgi:ABC-2 type transport system permease protein
MYGIGFYTLVRRELRRFMRMWTQTLIPPVITMSLYFVIFGKMVGSQIAPLHGVSYMQYIAPGLIMMSVVTNSYINTVSSFYLLRFQKNIDEMLISPLPPSLMLLGFMLGGIFRGLVVGVLVTVLSLFFTKLSIHHIGLMIITVLLTATVFSLAGFLNGIFARSFDDITIVPTFVLTPLTYLGGVFYSISMLPEFWHKLSLFNPILYLVNAFRYSLLGITDIPVAYALGLMFILALFLFGLNYYLLKKGQGVRS